MPSRAYARNARRSATPLGVALSTFMSSGPMVEKTSILQRERETATFRRLHPPSWLRGPNFMVMRPSLSRPNPTEKSMMSRSSPWTFSRLFTNSGSSSRPTRSAMSLFFLQRASSLRSIRDRWLMLEVTMPILFSRVSGSESSCCTLWTTAVASASFCRVLPLSYTPSRRWRTTREDRSSLDGNVRSLPS